jgi:hypothetical protein
LPKHISPRFKWSAFNVFARDVVSRFAHPQGDILVDCSSEQSTPFRLRGQKRRTSHPCVTPYQRDWTLELSPACSRRTSTIQKVQDHIPEFNGESHAPQGAAQQANIRNFGSEFGFGGGPSPPPTAALALECESGRCRPRLPRTVDTREGALPSPPKSCGRRCSCRPT